MEKQWLADQAKKLEDDMLALSKAQKQDVEKLVGDHEDDIREATDKWAASKNASEADLKKALDQVQKDWDAKLAGLKRTMDAK